MQIMLKGGDKHASIICDAYSKLSLRKQKECHTFTIWATFNNTHGVLIANF